MIRVQALYAAGLTSRKIAVLLPCLRDTDGGPSAIADRKLVDELVGERERINRTIADPLLSRDVLEEVIDAATQRVDAPAEA